MVSTAHLREGLRLLLKKTPKKLIPWKRIQGKFLVAWLRDPEWCWILGQDELPGLPLLPGKVWRVRLGAALSSSSIQKVRDHHLPWKSRRRYYFSSRCFCILRTERVLDPDMAHYLILIKSKYQNPLM